MNNPQTSHLEAPGLANGRNGDASAAPQSCFFALSKQNKTDMSAKEGEDERRTYRLLRSAAAAAAAAAGSGQTLGSALPHTRWSV